MGCGIDEAFEPVIYVSPNVYNLLKKRVPSCPDIFIGEVKIIKSEYLSGMEVMYPNPKLLEAVDKIRYDKMKESLRIIGDYL